MHGFRTETCELNETYFRVSGCHTLKLRKDRLGWVGLGWVGLGIVRLD